MKTKMYIFVYRKTFTYGIKVGFHNPTTDKIEFNKEERTLTKRKAMILTVNNVYWGKEKLDYSLEDIVVINTINERFIIDVLINLALYYNILLPKEQTVNL